jgi:dTDP-4-dehydrorhamnose 3,5-epimerase
MIIKEANIAGAWFLDLAPQADERGFFARTWCERELAEAGLDPGVVQESMSFTRRRGTLRGLHFQSAPHAETKIVRCTRGAIFDVVVDLRRNSPTYLRWEGVELSEHNRRSFYVPKGCIHGFQTLTDDVEVTYKMSDFHAPEAAGGYRYDDPAFAITWPIPVALISDRDLQWPAFRG